MEPPSTWSKAGFSLVELLIAIVVVSVVLAFSYPAYRSVRASYQAVQCLRNMRTIHTAVFAFASDYNRKLPPPLGPQVEVDPRFNHNQYWYQQAYLARYIVGPPDRKRDSQGKLKLEEVNVFNCPARDRNEEAALDKNDNPTASYLMPSIFRQQDFILGNLEPSRILLLEGRGAIVSHGQCKTAKVGSSDKSSRLRRYHQNKVHVLYHDGHVEAYSGEDADLVEKLPPY